MKQLRSNAHTHSTFCDGSNTLEEMVQAAIGLGFTDLGFTGHSHIPFSQGWTMGVQGTAEYRKEVLRLREKYHDIICISLGIELDSVSRVNREDYQFIVGSKHFVQSEETGAFYMIEGTPYHMQQAIDEGFHGNVKAMVETFYRQAAELPHWMQPDIIGHFDIITKLNSGNRYFDEDSAWYRQTAADAVDRAAQSGKIFEINTGGIYRGYRNTPYPAKFLLEHMAQIGAKVMINSDAHSTDSLDFMFPECLQLARNCGLKSLWVLHHDQFVEQEL